jgi:P22_AR N-terminal domain
VALRPLAGFLGLTWPPQYQRVMRDDILSRYVISLAMVGADGKRRKMVCLRLEYLPGWLFGIVPVRVKPELARKLIYYREHCFCVLWSAFQNRVHGVVEPLPHSWVGRSEASDEVVQLQMRIGYAYYQRAKGAVWNHCSRVSVPMEFRFIPVFGERCQIDDR